MKRDVNSYLHKFSKSVTALKQLYLRQSSVKSGHNVDFVTVRGDDVPPCQYREILLKPDQQEVKDKYAHVLKYWYHADLTEYPNSNGLTFYLLDSDLNIISDFIDPSDKLVDGRLLSRGYFPEVFGVKPITNELELISPIYYNFEAYSGILYFEKGKTPKDLGYTAVKLNAFQYIGKNVKQYFHDVELLIAMNLMLMQKLSALRIVIQPYHFSTLNMTTVWDTPRQIPGVFNKFGNPMICQRFSIVIPGYVFETSAVSCYDKSDPTTLLNLFENGVIIPDIVHYEDGSTKIEILLLLDAGLDAGSTGTGQVIIGYEEIDEDNNKILKMRVGLINFVAYAFKRNDNQVIDLKDPVVINNKGTTLTAITPDLKKKLLIDRYIVDFSTYSSDKQSPELINPSISSFIEKTNSY